MKKKTHVTILTLLLTFSSLLWREEGGSEAFAQFIGGNADGHSMIANETYVASCSLPVYFNTSKGGNANGHSMVANETYIAFCSLPAYFNISKGGNADGYASVSSGSCFTFLGCDVIAAVTNDTTICAGDTITLIAGGGIKYKWQTGNVSDTLSTLIVSPVVTTTYTVDITDSCSVPVSVTVSVRNIPVAGINGVTDICKTGGTILTASGGTTGYSWSTGETTAAITVNPQADSLYTVTAFDGVCADTASVGVTRFIMSPIMGDSIICAGKGDSTVLTALAKGATSYLWNTGETIDSITVSPAADFVYKVTVSDGTCEDSDSIKVIVAPPPIAFITGTTTICSGTSTTLTASGGNTYLWNTSETLATVNVNPAADTSYVVSVFIGSCSDTESVDIKVNPAPVIATSNVSVISGASTVITASATGSNTYTWSSSSYLSCTVCQSPVVSATGTSIYYVTVADSNGCVSSDSVVVTVLEPQCEVFVPNAFSPNSDGQNDFLMVHGDCITELSFSIYDRWGEKVFETKDINTGWDGIYRGKYLNDAVFVYYLNATLNNEKKIEKNGNISLIR